MLALPSETTSVDILLTGTSLKGQGVKANIPRDRFENGVARITIDKLPLGELLVGVVLHGEGEAILGKGEAKAKDVPN